VYIDGRTNILYPLEHMKRWYQVSNSSDLLIEEAQRFGFRNAIVSNDYEDVLLIHGSGKFQLDFSDAEYSLYTQRPNANFPALGLLWAEPECWNENLHKQVVAEQTQAILLLPIVSPLHTLLNVAIEFSNAEDAAKDLRLLAQAPGLNDPARRFLGHRALQLGQLALAHQTFSAIEKKSANDYLAAAFASLRGGNPDAAEDILDTATRLPWYHLDAVNLATLYQLLTEINSVRALKHFETAYYEDLRLQLDEIGVSVTADAMTPSAFCPRLAEERPVGQ